MAGSRHIYVDKATEEAERAIMEIEGSDFNFSDLYKKSVILFAEKVSKNETFFKKKIAELGENKLKIEKNIKFYKELIKKSKLKIKDDEIIKDKEKFMKKEEISIEKQEKKLVIKRIMDLLFKFKFEEDLNRCNNLSDCQNLILKISRRNNELYMGTSNHQDMTGFFKYGNIIYKNLKKYKEYIKVETKQK